MSFNDAVLTWMQHHDATAGWTPKYDAESVTSVRGDGSDWAGDTEAGFYSTFSVDVAYQKAGGKPAYVTVEGDALASLWEWVVSTYPG